MSVEYFKTEINLHRIETFNFRQEIYFEYLKHRLNDLY